MTTQQPNNKLTKVVNLRLEKCDVKICRHKGKIPKPPLEGCFGNPIPLKNVDDEQERIECIAKFREYFHARIELDLNFREAVLGLRGKTLGCFCKQPDREVACHGDVIVEWLNSV